MNLLIFMYVETIWSNGTTNDRWFLFLNISKLIILIWSILWETSLINTLNKSACLKLIKLTLSRNLNKFEKKSILFSILFVDNSNVNLNLIPWKNRDWASKISIKSKTVFNCYCRILVFGTYKNLTFFEFVFFNLNKLKSTQILPRGLGLGTNF